MKKIFYADKNVYSSSEAALREVFTTYLQIPDPVFGRTKNGKPYFQSPSTPSVHFSLSHTKDKLFIALSDREIGIDAESMHRNVRYAPIVKQKFTAAEQKDVQSSADFLRLWTVKESVIKRIGGTLGKDLKKISYRNGVVYYDQTPLDATISLFLKDEYVVCVCCETSFQDAEWIALPSTYSLL